MWSGSVTKSDSLKIERSQKTAFHIILGEKYSTYTEAMEVLNLTSLSEGRIDLCTKLAMKAF